MKPSVMRALRRAGLVLALAAGCATSTSAPPVAPAPAVAPAPSPAVDALLTRMHARLALMDGVARAKWNAQRPVDDPAREAALLASMREGARSRGLDPDEVERFFRAQIEAGKTVQRDRIAQWTAAHQPLFDDAPDLARDLRPRIDAINEALLDALRGAAAVLAAPEAQAYLRARGPAILGADGAGDRSAQAPRQALAPLVAGSQPPRPAPAAQPAATPAAAP